MNLLITGAFKPTIEQRNAIETLGYNITDMPQEKDTLPVDPATIEATICNGLFLHHDIGQFANLKFIQLTSAGLDRVPVDMIESRGIKLCNARGVYSIPMAEWTVMRILEHYKSPDIFNINQKDHRWEKRRDLRELAGANVAIVGAGNVGGEIAARLRVFGTHITGYDVHLFESVSFDKIRLISDFKTHIANYDIVILTAPLTADTHHIIDRDILNKMKTGAMLVNVARGGLVDESALTDVMTRRGDLYAALDVFENEPLDSDSQLWNYDNIRISPHNSFVGDGNQRRLFEVILKNLQQYATHR